MLTILSFGGGQDSQAIAMMLIHDPGFRQKYAPGELIAIMADTANEYPHTVAHVERMRKYFSINDIPFFLVGEEYRTDSWKGGLVFQWTRGIPTIGSKAYPKTCTDNLKIRPIYKFLAKYLEDKGYGMAYAKKSLYGYMESHGKIRVLIGIARGEEKRVGDPDKVPNKWMRDTVEMQYPLVDLGMNRDDCQTYLHGMESKTGIPCPYPSNCIFCPFNQEFDLVWQHRHMPEKLDEWMALEAAKLEGDVTQRIISDKKSLGVWGKPNFPLSMVLEKALEKYGHMSDAELNTYKFSHGHCVSSTY